MCLCDIIAQTSICREEARAAVQVVYKPCMSEVRSCQIRLSPFSIKGKGIFRRQGDLGNLVQLAEAWM